MDIGVRSCWNVIWEGLTLSVAPSGNVPRGRGCIIPLMLIHLLSGILSPR